MHRHLARRDEGSASIEAAILFPVLLLFLLIAITAGRIVLAGQAVDAAAEDAARDASLARTSNQAAGAAEAAARSTLAQQGLHCTSGGLSVHVRVELGRLGVGGTVTTTVVCNVALSDLAFPGAPGSHTVTSSFTSTIDRYTEHQ
ncbi:TadE/TadG family type IV pilus assembly protein [Kitasatospora xanthocidica]|uniref:TadE/TadG family type IV pilus assembly protein n=1 Tax=Kitasatospora xanthocidica TaxID=83382 RepID=UPI0036E657ED